MGDDHLAIACLQAIRPDAGPWHVFRTGPQAILLTTAQSDGRPSLLAKVGRSACDHEVREAVYLSALGWREPLELGYLHPDDVRRWPFAIYPWIEGQSFRTWSAAHELTANMALRVMHGVAKSLQQIHERGLVHNDLHVDNVLITPRGEVIVIDLGSSAHERDSLLGWASPGVPGERFVALRKRDFDDYQNLARDLEARVRRSKVPGDDVEFDQAKADLLAQDGPHCLPAHLATLEAMLGIGPRIRCADDAGQGSRRSAFSGEALLALSRLESEQRLTADRTACEQLKALLRTEQSLPPGSLRPTMASLGVALSQIGDYQAGYYWLARATRPASGDDMARDDVRYWHLKAGEAARFLGQLDHARVHLEAVVEGSREDLPDTEGARRLDAMGCHQLAEVRRRLASPLTEIEAAQTRAARGFLMLGDEYHMAWAKANMARDLAAGGRYDEAIVVSERAQAALSRLCGIGHLHTASMITDQASFLAAAGRLDDAFASFAVALQIREAWFDDPFYVQALRTRVRWAEAILATGASERWQRVQEIAEPIVDATPASNICEDRFALTRLYQCASLARGTPRGRREAQRAQRLLEAYGRRHTQTS